MSGKINWLTAPPGWRRGKNVQEMQVFTVGLRQKELDKRVLTAIAQAIPYKILFVLTYLELAQAWLEVEGTFYHTEWQALADLKLTFSGTNLDNVYENLARQIAGDRLDADQNLAQAVARDKQRDKLTREIKALQQKILREKQFNRQVELNGELKKLQAAMEQL